MATEIAQAYIALTTKMTGVKNDIAGALNGSDVTSTVSASGKSMGNVLSGAIGGAVALGAAKAISMVKGAIDGAITRVDMMNNFPKVMANLGYSSDDAAASIQKMSERLTGLPTALDSMAGMVQQLAPLTGGLDEATELSLALNNALLAGGKSTEIQANAMEQYTQMLSVGKVDMAAWRSMVSAMPGQMNQLAESLLGTGAGAMDLYAAMQDGTVGFDEFNNAILALNSEGTGAFASFEEQARSATDGIATSQANLNTAITRGLAGLIDKVQPQITAILGAVTAGVGVAFSVLGGAFDWIAQHADIIGPILAGVAVALLVLLAPAIWAAVVATWAWTAALLANPLTWIVVAIIAVVAAIVWLWQNWDQVTAWITEVWSGFLSWITDVIDGFVGWWNGVWSAVGQFISDVWNNIVNWVQSALDWIVDMFLTWTVFGIIIDNWNNIVQFFVDTWNNILRGIEVLKAGFVAVFEFIGGAIRGAFEGAVGFIRGVINGIIDLINGAIGGINGIVGAVGGVFGLDVSIPSIPRLADGGIVRGSSGGTLALVGEAGRGRDEAVIPLPADWRQNGLGGVPRELVIVDADRQLIGRMQVEADGRIAHAVPSGAAVHSQFAR